MAQSNPQIPPSLMNKAIFLFNGDRKKAKAWFRYPNGWISNHGPDGPVPVGPEDELGRHEDVLNALAKLSGSYTA
jgi:hypothetical protein